MTSVDLTLLVIGRDREALTAFDSTHSVDCNLVMVSNEAGVPLAIIANEYLGQCQSDVFGLCHADLVIGPGALSIFVDSALNGAVCGPVGMDLSRTYRCCYRNSREGDYAGPGPVSTLDGMGVFFRSDIGIRFDEQLFDGMHCHVEDFCLQASKKGIPVVVPAADAHHRNHDSTPEWIRDYWVYRKRLDVKWKGVAFETT